MTEVLPVRLLTEEDALLFGSLNVALGKLYRAGLPVAPAVVITPPNLKLKTVLEHYDFGSKEVFEQSLTLVKKEINSTPIPQSLIAELGKHKQFFLNGNQIKSVKDLWLSLLDIWIKQLKIRLWTNGFYLGITEGLDPQVIVLVKKIQSFGKAYFDPLQDDAVIHAKYGHLQPKDLKKIAGLVQLANKKLFIPHEYEWILDGGVKLVKVLSYTPAIPLAASPIVIGSQASPCKAKSKSAVKIFFDLSVGLTVEKDVDGIYISAEKIFDLNKPRDSFENLVFRLVDSAVTFSSSPVFLKLADQSEGMGKIRGAFRLIHQRSLLTPLVEALDFARHKKSLFNVHIVVPFVRGVGELLQVKRELAAKKLMRKNSLQVWMEACVPENIINLENYLQAGIDGVVLNLDELVSYLNGFDALQEDLLFYKAEVEGLIKFLADAIRSLHKTKIPFIAYGNLSLYPKVLEFLVENGVYGVVVQKYEAHFAKDLLYQAEKRMILHRSS